MLLSSTVAVKIEATDAAKKTPEVVCPLEAMLTPHVDSQKMVVFKTLKGMAHGHRE